MTAPAHPVIRRYAAGEISAMQAAGELGVTASVADVIVMLRQAGLKPPEPPPERERAELARARHILGLDRAGDPAHASPTAAGSPSIARP